MFSIAFLLFFSKTFSVARFIDLTPSPSNGANFGVLRGQQARAGQAGG